MLNDATCFEHIYIALGYTDLRSGIDRLVAIIKNYDKGSIFLFCGRRTDRIKAIVFEEDGIVLLYKRLSDGKYQWSRTASEVQEITPQQYRWLMDGLSIEQKKVIKKTKPDSVIWKISNDRYSVIKVKSCIKKFWKSA